MTYANMFPATVGVFTTGAGTAWVRLVRHPGPPINETRSRSWSRPLAVGPPGRCRVTVRRKAPPDQWLSWAAVSRQAQAGSSRRYAAADPSGGQSLSGI